MLSAVRLGLALGIGLPSLANAEASSTLGFADLKSWTFPDKSQPPEEFLSTQDAGKLKLVLKLGPSKQWIVDPQADFKEVGVEAIGFNFRERAIYPLYPAEYTVGIHPVRLIGGNTKSNGRLSSCHDDVDDHGYAGTDLKGKRLMGYSPCSSSLTKNYVTIAVAGSLSHAIDSFTGSFLQHPARDYVVTVNPEAVATAVTSSNALAVAIQTLQDNEKADVAAALTSVELRNVIQRYQNLDLTNQIPDAVQQEQILHTAEYRNDYSAALSANTSEGWRQFAVKYANFDPDQHLDSAQATYMHMLAAENQERARAQTEQQTKEAEALSYWRKSVTVGTHTHCGPVLDKRGTLVQVYFPVINYGNEHWIEANELYPEGSKGCHFSNGRYISSQ